MASGYGVATGHLKTQSKATASGVWETHTSDADPGNEWVVDPTIESSVPVTNGNNQSGNKTLSGPSKEIPKVEKMFTSERVEPHMAEKLLKRYSFFLISPYPPTH
jgi:hypothetical protein